MRRARIAAPVMLVYWAMLVGGLSLYATIRSDDIAAVMPLWFGAISGTALGHMLALRDSRLWSAISVIIATLVCAVTLIPGDTWSFAMAFLPAALCALWSLSDRASLAGFWFPLVIWMLSILDRTDATAMPDAAGGVLLGAVAVLFIIYLRVRETRRVEIWRTVAAVPLALSSPPIVFRQPSHHQLARAGWGLLVTALTFVITAEVAPELWRTEPVGSHDEPADLSAIDGVPCCPPVHDEVEVARVDEYFDIGRGHDHHAHQRPNLDCRVCPAQGASGEWGDVPDDSGPVMAIAGSPGAPAGYGAYGTRYTHPVLPAGPHMPGVSGMPAAPYDSPGTVPSVSTAPPVVSPPAPGVVQPAPPQITTTPPPLPPPAPPARAAPISPPPSVVPQALPRPVAVPHAAPAPSTVHAKRAATSNGADLLHWIVVLVAGALIMQVVRLGLRPVRRSLALRHLRRPFWAETIDQRVSNSWQLALVGLRDAGWRSTMDEAPREFARRAGVDGLERCATILERTRHGLAVDSEDLETMARSADVAYRSARDPLGPLARAAAAIRWPLT